MKTRPWFIIPSRNPEHRRRDRRTKKKKILYTLKVIEKITNAIRFSVSLLNFICLLKTRTAAARGRRGDINQSRPVYEVYTLYQSGKSQSYKPRVAYKRCLIVINNPNLGEMVKR